MPIPQVEGMADRGDAHPRLEHVVQVIFPTGDRRQLVGQRLHRVAHIAKQAQSGGVDHVYRVHHAPMVLGSTRVDVLVAFLKTQVGLLGWLDQLPALSVTTWRGIEQIGGSQPGDVLGVVRRYLFALHMDGVLGADLAQLFPGHLDAIGQDVAEPFPLGDLFGQGDDGLGVTPGHLQAIGLLLGQQAVLIALDHVADGRAHRDGVQSIVIADFIEPDDGGQVIVQQIGAKHAKRLVFWLVADTIVLFQGERTTGLPHFSPTGDGTVPTAIALVAVHAGDGFAADLVRAFAGKVNQPGSAPILDRRVAILRRVGGNATGAQVV